MNPAKKIKSPACGWCHPGGGSMEYGRRPDGTPDFSMNLIQAERRNTNSLDGDFMSLISPDGKSHFKESGVVEGDCLICHTGRYQFGKRNQQINHMNYRWAATAGADIAKIEGSIFKFDNPDAPPGAKGFMDGTWNFSERPKVTYRWDDRNLFSREGQLKGTLISKTVEVKNCLQCHQGPDAKKVGWVHKPEFDAHYKAGFRCTDCHGLVGNTRYGRMEHQIAKGWHPLGSVRDDLDGVDMMTCQACHIAGRYRPSRPGLPEKAKDPTKKHAEKFPDVAFHFNRISCANCHSTGQPGMSGYLLDMGPGGQIWYTAATLETITWSDDFGKLAPKPWKPWSTLFDARNGLGEQYIPQVPKVSQWFGEKMDNLEVRPISLRYVKKAFGTLNSRTVVDVRNTDGQAVKKPTVAREEEIRAMIEALTGMGFTNVVFVSDRVYELRDGQVTAYEDPLTAHPHTFPVHHNIVPLDRGTTYGQKGKPEGCRDCHWKDSEFFTKMLIRNPGRFLLEDYPVPREPNAEPQMIPWGFDEVPVPPELKAKKEP